MFGRDLLRPDLKRKPVYDNLNFRDGRWQTFICAHCHTSIPLDIEQYVGRDEDPESVLGPANGRAVRIHFGILEKSLANGWPFLKVEICPYCGAKYLVYVAAFEPRNGWSQGVLQGITELLPSNLQFDTDALRRST